MYNHNSEKKTTAIVVEVLSEVRVSHAGGTTDKEISLGEEGAKV